MTPFTTTSVLETPVSFIAPRTLVEVLASIVEVGEPRLVFHQNLHGAYLQRRDPAYRRLFDLCDLAYADGMPFILLVRMGGHRVEPGDRATYLDWEDMFLRRCVTEGWRVFYIGGRPASLASGLEALRRRYPGLEIRGCDGYFDLDPDSPRSREVVAEANAFGASIVLVGLGMPLQERWAAEQRSQLEAPVVLAVGAGIDYASGEIARPPRWMGRIGFEWLYRLAKEPRRLGSRYLVEPLWLLVPAFTSVVRSRRSGSMSGTIPGPALIGAAVANDRPDHRDQSDAAEHHE
jgi:N-acetylglucosaminyldiphosphoundecaprenol N-acetyl-beta-D-mannosaminyltransferase